MTPNQKPVTVNINMNKLDYREKEVETCLEWMKAMAKKTKRFNRKTTSYGLKHQVERWSGGYVREHSFIKAAEIAGFKADRPQADRFPDDPSANYNISFKSINYES